MKKTSYQKQITSFSANFLHSRAIFYFASALLITKILIVLIFFPFPRNIFFADVTKIDLLHLLNHNRELAGLNYVTENDTLNKAAALKAQDMIEKQYFSHVSPEGVEPWFWIDQAGYKYEYAGENLAIGFINSKDVHNAWIQSASHKANILESKYTNVGMAVASGFGENNAIIVVQLFANPLPVTPSPEQEIEAMQEPALENNEPVIDSENPEGTVLSGTYNYYLTKASGKERNTPYLQFVNFIVHDSEPFFRNLAVIAIVIICSSLLFIINTKRNVLTKNLVFRSLLIVLILLVSTAINQNTFWGIMPNLVSI